MTRSASAATIRSLPQPNTLPQAVDASLRPASCETGCEEGEPTEGKTEQFYWTVPTNGYDVRRRTGSVFSDSSSGSACFDDSSTVSFPQETWPHAHQFSAVRAAPGRGVVCAPGVQQRLEARAGLAAAFFDLEGHFHLRSSRALQLGEEELNSLSGHKDEQCGRWHLGLEDWRALIAGRDLSGDGCEAGGWGCSDHSKISCYHLTCAQEREPHHGDFQDAPESVDCSPDNARHRVSREIEDMGCRGDACGAGDTFDRSRCWSRSSLGVQSQSSDGRLGERAGRVRVSRHPSKAMGQNILSPPASAAGADGILSDDLSHDERRGSVDSCDTEVARPAPDQRGQRAHLEQAPTAPERAAAPSGHSHGEGSETEERLGLADYGEEGELLTRSDFFSAYDSRELQRIGRRSSGSLSQNSHADSRDVTSAAQDNVKAKGLHACPGGNSGKTQPGSQLGEVEQTGSDHKDEERSSDQPLPESTAEKQLGRVQGEKLYNDHAQNLPVDVLFAAFLDNRTCYSLKTLRRRSTGCHATL